MSDHIENDPPAKVGYGNPPVEHQFKPGQSGNPEGRPKNAGQSIREAMNDLAAAGLSEGELRAIERNKRESFVRRAAARVALRTVETGDMADFEDFLNGKATLTNLRERGIDTTLIRKSKRYTTKTTFHGGSKDGEEIETEFTAEVELHDRATEHLNQLMDRTDGRPTQSVRVDATVDHQNVPTVAAALLDPNVVAAAIELEERMRNASGSGQLRDTQ